MNNLLSRIFVIGLATLSLTFSSDAKLQIECERFVLIFASDGRISSIMTKDGEELLDIKNPGAGFVIRYKKADMAYSMPLISQPDTEHLLASTSVKTQQVLFRIIPQKQHIGFQIEKLIGFPPNSDLTLSFEINTKDSIRVFEHDYMTEIQNTSNGVGVYWNYLWQRVKGDPMGGFSLYHCRDLADEDEAILEIWAKQGLVHPATGEEWTVDAAGRWLKQWQQRFKNRAMWSQFSIMYFEPLKTEDMFIGAGYAQKAGVDALYLMPWSWRGEYWPNYKTTVGINTELFPDGEAGIKALSDHCNALGLGLELHYVSGGIGFNDPVYVADKPDERLAGWGAATLLDSIDENATQMRIKLSGGTMMPYRTPEGYSGNHDYRYPALEYNHGYNIMQVGNELIRVGEFENETEDIWILKKVERGFGSTDSVGHGENSIVKGLVSAYDRNLLPDNYSTLFTEIAEAYAGFLNRCNITQAVFDGIEIHRFFGFGQGDKFICEVYRRLERPTVTHNSSGAPPKCWLEYRFNSTKELLGTSQGAHADIIADHPSRPATTLLDAAHALAQAAARNSRAYGVRCSDRGVTIETLQTHGRTDNILELVRNWRDVDKVLTPEQRKTMLATNYPNPNYPLRLAGYHPNTPLIYTLEKNMDKWEIFPTLVMTRKEGDIKWISGQEHGSISPAQFVISGQKLELNNPYDRQEVHFVIQVLYGHDYNDPQNISIPVDFKNIINDTDTILEPSGADGLSLSYNNSRSEDMWQENAWPGWSVGNLDMVDNRAVGMWVTGDGSKSVLIFNIFQSDYEQRDYVIPIDFNGERYIEIPHGQAAWATSRWGWRQCTWKFCDYSKISTVKLGFGNISPATHSSIAVRGIKALKQLPCVVVNPIVHIDGGSLEIIGEVSSTEYIEYNGGENVSVYDKNWNYIKKLQVKKTAFYMENGWANIWLTADEQQTGPWFETKFIVRDKPMIVTELKKEKQI